MPVFGGALRKAQLFDSLAGVTCNGLPAVGRLFSGDVLEVESKGSSGVQPRRVPGKPIERYEIVPPFRNEHPAKFPIDEHGLAVGVLQHTFHAVIGNGFAEDPQEGGNFLAQPIDLPP